MRKCTQACVPHRSRTRQQLPDRVVGVRGPGPPASGCDKATSCQEVRCALHFLSLSRFSRALSLQLPLVSSQRQKKKLWEQEPEAPGQYPPSSGEWRKPWDHKGGLSETVVCGRKGEG